MSNVAELLGERNCTQRPTGFESFCTNLGEVLWQGYLRQRPTMRKDLRVHNAHLCLREVHVYKLLALREGLMPDKGGCSGHANHPYSGRMEASRWQANQGGRGNPHICDGSDRGEAYLYKFFTSLKSTRKNGSPPCRSFL